MDRKLKNILKYTLSLGLAALLLYFSFRGINWKDFMEALRSCRWEFVALSMVFGLMGLFIRGLRWKMLLLPIDPSTKTMTSFNATNICMLVNLAVPRAGEIVRCGFITRRSARDAEGHHLASFDKVLGTVLVERAWDAMSVVIVAVVSMAVMWKRFGFFVSENILPALREKAGLVWVALLALVAVALLVWMVWKFRDRVGVFGRICSSLKGFSTGMSSCMKMQGAWKFFIYTLFIWLIYWLMSACIMWAVRDSYPDFGMGDALFMMFVGAMSSVIPVPGGFGVFHGAVAYAMSAVYGLPFPTGLIMATLSHESQALMQLLSGLASYAYETVRKED